MPDQKINWPAFIKYAGDAELTFVSDGDEWIIDADLSSFEYADGDFLVDSSGKTFSLRAMKNDRVIPKIGGRQLDCKEATRLIRGHFSAIGQCCVAKMHSLSLEECMSMLRNESES